MTRQTLAAFVFLAALPLTVPAAEPAAQDPGRSGATSSTEAPPMFKELDKNHDGQISQSEAKRSADITARFSTLDADKNKQISVTEWQADDKSRGAAGVSGESRDSSGMKEQPMAPEKSGETPKPSPGKSTY